MFTLTANADDLDLSQYEKSNVSGDSIDDDAEKSTNQRDNDKEQLETSSAVWSRRTVLRVV